MLEEFVCRHVCVVLDLLKLNLKNLCLYTSFPNVYIFITILNIRTFLQSTHTFFYKYFWQADIKELFGNCMLRGVYVNETSMQSS